MSTDSSSDVDPANAGSYPWARMFSHIGQKGWQAGSLVGGALIGPILAYRAGNFEVAVTSAGRGGLIGIGLVGADSIPSCVMPACGAELRTVEEPSFRWCFMMIQSCPVVGSAVLALDRLCALCRVIGALAWSQRQRLVHVDPSFSDIYLRHLQGQ